MTILKKIGEDKNNCREYYKDNNGKVYASTINADGKVEMFTTTEEGEPLRPVKNLKEWKEIRGIE